MQHYTPRHTYQHDYTACKIVAVGCLFGLFWLVLWGRAFQVQVLQGKTLSRMASRQHQAAEYINGERGDIVDRQGRVLAKSVTCRSVYARPLQIGNRRAVAGALADVLGMPQQDIHKRISSTRPFVWISREIADRAATAIEELKLPGVHLVTEYRRVYPHGSLAGQLLGFAGIDGQGLEGLEKTFDRHLAGEDIRRTIQRDASGRRLHFEQKPSFFPVRGADLQLTIDAEIQSITELALEKAVRQYNGKWGASLVVHVASGEILAWAQYPFFNPNIYRQYSPEIWRNRLAMDALEPGSTFKPFVVAAALQEKIISRDSLFYCEDGTWDFYDTSISDTRPHKNLPVHKVIRYSSNICAAKIGLQLGTERFYSYLKKLGFGGRVSLPLPGQSRGILHDPAQWSPVDLASIAFGQGIATTGLQLVEGYLCLAREGFTAPLKLIAGKQEPFEGTRVFDAAVATEVLSMLRDVVQEDGTGKRARIAGLETGGKTGTAQKADPAGGYGDKYLASFAGFLPAMQPEFLLFVMVDEPHPSHYGGVVAAPVVREEASRILAYLGRLPQTQASRKDRQKAQAFLQKNISPPVANKQTTKAKRTKTALLSDVHVPDVVGLSLREAIELFAHSGVIPEIRGRGSMVTRQRPDAGNTWKKAGRRAVVWLAPDARQAEVGSVYAAQ